MRKQQKQVKEFHRTFDLGVGTVPGIPNEESWKRRVKLIEEEFNELAYALQQNDIVETADALGDLLYVVLGSAVEFGIDMEPVFEAIHISNMSKVGGHKNEYGKFVKPATYTPVDLAPIIEKQRRQCQSVAQNIMEQFEFQRRHGE